MGFTPIVPDGCPFTINNIPFGVISDAADPRPRCAVAFGDYALDLEKCFQHVASNSLGDHDLARIFGKPSLNDFAGLKSTARTVIRKQIIAMIESKSLPESCFHPLATVKMHLPMQISDYTDFFCSLEHCQNCAPMSGGKIPPNFFHIPLAYNGRASSVLPSPHPIRRPKGAIHVPEKTQPVHEASRKLDFELEMGYFVSKPIPYGSTLNIEEAAEHIFGFVLLNDWSSRDIQGFEMAPLGPFNSKSFGTSISPWVVTLDALEPFVCGPKHEHSPLSYLELENKTTGTFDIDLKVTLKRNKKAYTLCTSNLKYLYWTPLQQVVQHASAMCGLRTGDLIGTGTISGDGTDSGGKKKELGCLFEATRNGQHPLIFDDGEELTYLQDGDEIILEGWCGGTSLGFGQCAGQILSSV